MYRLAFFLTALWLSSTAANPGFNIITAITNTGAGATAVAANEMQAVLDPVGKSVAYIGGIVCGPVKKLVGVAYESLNEEPDMSKLTLDMMTSGKTVIYKLSEAAKEIPKETWFDPKRPLKIFFHGFTEDPSKESFQTMNNAFAQLEETEAGLDPALIHLIGHSLGGHISGFTGQEFQRRMNGTKIGRISGLDPAGPCFSKLEPSERLSKDHAVFVDIMHTDNGVFGSDVQMGHVDFYPNSGSQQPGCLMQTCSHSRAWEYYAESVVNRKAFPAVSCNSDYEFRHGLCNYNDKSYMGYGSRPNYAGKYYLQTFGQKPYGAGEQGTTYKSNGLVRGITDGVSDIIT